MDILDLTIIAGMDINLLTDVLGINTEKGLFGCSDHSAHNDAILIHTSNTPPIYRSGYPH